MVHSAMGLFHNGVGRFLHPGASVLLHGSSCTVLRLAYLFHRRIRGIRVHNTSLLVRSEVALDHVDRDFTAHTLLSLHNNISA